MQLNKSVQMKKAKRPRSDSNRRITDLQSVPLIHLGTRPDLTSATLRLSLLIDGVKPITSPDTGTAREPLFDRDRAMITGHGPVGGQQVGHEIPGLLLVELRLLGHVRQDTLPFPD